MVRIFQEMNRFVVELLDVDDFVASIGEDAIQKQSPQIYIYTYTFTHIHISQNTTCNLLTPIKFNAF
jgi:hypothetical protein